MAGFPTTLARIAVVCTALVSLACAGGEEDSLTFGTSFGATYTTTASTLTTTGTMETTGEGDGDGDPDPTGDGDGDPGGAVCGNNSKEAGEFCDGSDLDGETCESLGYGGGTLTCRTDCSAFDISGCTVDTCGNGVLDEGELCDGLELQGQTCEIIGFGGGQLGCSPNCLSFDTSNCFDAVCGNNVVEGSELCDGADLQGETCQSQGFDVGNLACNQTCNGFDTSGCMQNQQGFCGDNQIDVGEVCDGANLNGQNCVTAGYAGGTLQCVDCMQFDVALCHDGDCCTDNLYAGCEVMVVQDCVCALDSYCCDNFWDALCVTQAVNDCSAQCL